MQSEANEKSFVRNCHCHILQQIKLTKRQNLELLKNAWEIEVTGDQNHFSHSSVIKPNQKVLYVSRKDS